MNSENELLPFEVFPDDDEWRIDYIGNLSINHNMPSSPFVNLEISKVKFTPEINCYTPKVVREETKQRIQASIFFLHIYEIGSIWKRRAYFQPPVAKTKTLKFDIKNPILNSFIMLCWI